MSNRTLSVTTPDALSERYHEQGYAYLDDNACLVDSMPDRGWFITERVDGQPTAIRLTDQADDPQVKQHTAHLRTDL